MIHFWKYALAKHILEEDHKLQYINHKSTYYDEMISILRPVLDVIPEINSGKFNIKIYELGHIKPLIHTHEPDINIASNVSFYVSSYISVNENEIKYIINCPNRFSLIMDIMVALHEICHIIQHIDETVIDDNIHQKHSQIFSLLLYLRMFKSKVSDADRVQMSPEYINELRTWLKISRIKNEDEMIRKNNMHVFDESIYNFDPADQESLDSLSFLDMCILDQFILTSGDDFRLTFQTIDIIKHLAMNIPSENIKDLVMMTYRESLDIALLTAEEHIECNPKLFREYKLVQFIENAISEEFGMKHELYRIFATIFSCMFTNVYQCFRSGDDKIFDIKIDRDLLAMNDLIHSILANKYQTLIGAIIYHHAETGKSISTATADIISEMEIIDSIDFVLVIGNSKPRRHPQLCNPVRCGHKIFDIIADRLKNYEA